ncbi:TPA: pentapeptide repeat-containing protein [Campylobacter jejuni]|nr:pentapeptide repeat-containing protein [Campylobacter jejuni]
MEEFDKEKAIEDIAKKLNVEKNKILYIEYSNLFQINDCVISIIDDNIKVFQEYNLYFYRCTIPNLILEITIKSLEFKMCCFESSFMIRNNFDGYISIQDSIFEKDFGIFWVKKEIYKINVCKNTFKDVSIFENKILNFNFEENSIQNISICNNLFTKEAYFNANSFNYECIFFKNSFENLSFYGANFEKSFIFFQNIIKGNLNAVNTNLNFTFDDLQKRIKQEYEDFNKTKEEQDKKPLDKFANDFRDSFRTFKSALIKDNNLLDASNFHKYELYCKEIELKQNWDKKGENVKNTTDLEKNVLRIRDFVDFLLLGFYRKLCDHHTDFLKVFNNLILLITLYALFFWGFTWLQDDKLEDTRAILTLFGFFDDFKFCFNIGVGIFIVLGFILTLHKIDKNFIKSFSKILKFFKYLPYIKKWLLKIFKKEIFIKLFSSLKIIRLDLEFLIESLIIVFFIPCVFYVLFSLFGFFLNLGKDFGYSIFINTLFVSLYICLVYTKSLFFGRYIMLIISYIGFFTILIKQPSIIHPLIGKITNESDKFFNYPSLIILNILYTILLTLVLFSLQKTARKNSIVPS